LVGDPNEVVEDRLVVERLDDAAAGRAAGKAGRDHRLSQALDGGGDVDALAAGHRRLIDRAMTAPGSEAGDLERLVHRGVERDGDDHVASSSLPRRPMRRRRRTLRSSNAAVAAAAAMATSASGRVTKCAARER